MINTSLDSGWMRLPAYVVFFYAINCTIIPTGVMDPYMQMMSNCIRGPLTTAN